MELSSSGMVLQTYRDKSRKKVVAVLYITCYVWQVLRCFSDKSFGDRYLDNIMVTLEKWDEY